MNRREFVVTGLGLPLAMRALGGSPAMTESKHRAGREIMWRRLGDEVSVEHARVVETDSGCEISGAVLIAEKGLPLRVDYLLVCDAHWQTRTVYIEQAWRGGRRTMRLIHDGNGRWEENGLENATLAGCSDVDLGVTPSTNALPVNRLRLAVGEQKEIRAAWVRFPELDVAPARQMYTRIAENQYEYASLTSGFRARVDVDPGGLPTEYAGIWRRVAEGPATPESPSSSFARALISPEPSLEVRQAADTFGWLIGGWAAEVRDFDPDGQARSGAGEWWFAWVLEGRAIQDVWISPPRTRRLSGDTQAEARSVADNRYGTTVRWFDRREGLWRIVWVNPVSGAMNHLAGRREGDQVVLLGNANGTPIRWSFKDIRPNSFIWRGESDQGGGEWRLDAEFRLRKIM